MLKNENDRYYLNQKKEIEKAKKRIQEIEAYIDNYFNEAETIIDAQYDKDIAINNIIDILVESIIPIIACIGTSYFLSLFSMAGMGIVAVVGIIFVGYKVKKVINNILIYKRNNEILKNSTCSKPLDLDAIEYYYCIQGYKKMIDEIEEDFKLDDDIERLLNNYCQEQEYEEIFFKQWEAYLNETTHTKPQKVSIIQNEIQEEDYQDAVKEYVENIKILGKTPIKLPEGNSID